METKEFRASSVERLAQAGIRIPEALPLLDGFRVRPIEEILDRIVCLNAVAAAAHGFPREKALAWLSDERMLNKLTEEEQSFLRRGADNVGSFQVQVEGIWALAWVVSIVPEFDFWRGCDPRFVTKLPDLKKAQSSSQLRCIAAVRSSDEIGAACDLAYCLHWVLREASMSDAPPPQALTPYVVVERRRALEWTIGKEAWNTVSLDT